MSLHPRPGIMAVEPYVGGESKVAGLDPAHVTVLAIGREAPVDVVQRGEDPLYGSLCTGRACASPAGEDAYRKPHDLLHPAAAGLRCPHGL